jgi:hypothetical protein
MCPKMNALSKWSSNMLGREAHAVAMVAVLGPLLAGCVSSHSFYLMGRQSGVSGSGIVPANGRHGGPITITIGARQFTGQWIYMESGGSVGIETATGYSSRGAATATGIGVGLPTGGNGNVIASAPDGTTLRCAFNFSEIDMHGVGLCQDNKGETYDLQIN